MPRPHAKRSPSRLGAVWFALPVLVAIAALGVVFLIGAIEQLPAAAGPAAESAAAGAG